MKQRDTGVYPHGSVDNGSIEIQFMYEGRRRETLDLSPTVANLNYAKLKRRSITDRIALGQFTLDDYRKEFPNSKWLKKRQGGTAGIPTVSRLMEDWYERKKNGYKHSAGRRYQSSIRVMQKYLEPDLLVTKLTPEHLDKIVAKMQASGATTKTIRNNLIPLRLACQSVTGRNRLIQTNPVLEMDPIKMTELEEIRRSNEEEADPFDLSEINTIYEIAATIHNYEQILNFCETNIGGGFRPGEMFGLGWDDIDFNNNTIDIRRAKTDRKLCLPKTKKSRRTLDMFPSVKAALRRQFAITGLLPPVDCGPFGKIRFVFLHPATMSPWVDYQQFHAFWKPILRKGGLRYRSPGQMRHTFASLCISAGESEQWIADYMGHATVQMLRKHYARLLKEAARAAGREGGSKMRNLMEMSGKNSGKIPAQSPFFVTNGD